VAREKMNSVYAPESINCGAAHRPCTLILYNTSYIIHIYIYIKSTSQVTHIYCYFIQRRSLNVLYAFGFFFRRLRFNSFLINLKRIRSYSYDGRSRGAHSQYFYIYKTHTHTHTYTYAHAYNI